LGSASALSRYSITLTPDTEQAPRSPQGSRTDAGVGGHLENVSDRHSRPVGKDIQKKLPGLFQVCCNRRTT
jgi:hypothetical protein